MVDGEHRGGDYPGYGVDQQQMLKRGSSGIIANTHATRSTTVPKIVSIIGCKLTPAPRMEPDAFSIIEKIA